MGAYAVDSGDPRPGWRDGGVRTAEAALVAQQAVEGMGWSAAAAELVG